MDNFNKIEKYIYNQMSADETSAFEIELQKDEVLREEVTLHRLEKGVMQQIRENNLRAKLKTMKQEAKVVSMYSQNTWKYAMAAAILIVGCIFVVNNFSSNTVNSESLAMEIFKNPEYSSYRGDGDKTELDNIAILTAKEKYKEALEQLEKYPNKNDFEYQLLEATNLFHSKKFGAATSIYQSLIAQSKDTRKIEELEGYLLLSLLAEKGKDDTAFKTLYKKILDNSTTHSAGVIAKRLEEKLR